MPLFHVYIFLKMFSVAKIELFFFLPFKTLKMSLHCLLSCIISHQKSAAIFIFVLLNIMSSFFPFSGFKIFLFISFKQFDYIVPWKNFHHVSVLGAHLIFGSLGLYFSSDLESLTIIFKMLFLSRL